MRRALVGRLVSEDGSSTRGEVIVDGGVIVRVSSAVGVETVDSREDFGDAYLVPGMVDAHVHCLSDGGEGITAGTSSAAAGGVTTIIEMPFDGTGPINTLDRLLDKISRVEAQAVIDVALLGTVQPDGGWSEIGPMVENGAVGFKVSTFNTDSFRFPRSTIPQFRHIMAAIAEANSIVCVHAESDEVIRPMLEDAGNKASSDPRVHGDSRPPLAEELGAIQALATAREAGARVHICHLSLPESVKLSRWYRDELGADVTVETCPHYLLFNEGDVVRLRGRLKINPPVRSQEAVDGLWELIRDGVVDVISSDHAPWSVDKKSHEKMLDNSSGAPGVETIFASVLAGALERGEATFGAALKALTQTPADRYALGHRKGRIQVGYDADLAVFDPSEKWTIDETKLHSNAKWSPYHGMEIGGRIVRTISRGVDVWDGKEVLGLPGDGRFVRPERTGVLSRDMSLT